ncbi:hypothetical protein E4T50_16884 [Aureobasidium sp. EXF-12298]|nr:hypothetical protein E4T50_16884 [Aureobasidium sp. EXF-12298]KAI4750287.1 hypothetical protein E4T51_16386 [Aureobasidium sp. EXF-12344]KAI4767718.1 hypothetical protein E4T52_17144 [Aureobasidium sp. EXF-3400]
MAAPTVLDQESSPSSLVRRKNTNKCEAHIHVDTSNGLCGNSCTHKYKIDLLDNPVPAQAMGKDWNWANVGTWAAANPNYQIKTGTTRGLELWIDGSLPGGFITDSWRNSFTLNYGSQHWNSHECENWVHKGPRESNGCRHEYDLWCEFDC